MTSTHTVATLEVSKATYNEIAARLREAGYDHVFLHDGVIDMTGIGLVMLATPKRPVCGICGEPGGGCSHHEHETAERVAQCKVCSWEEPTNELPYRVVTTEGVVVEGRGDVKVTTLGHGGAGGSGKRSGK